MPTTPLPLANASCSTSKPSTSRTYSRVLAGGQIHAQALSVKDLPMPLRLRPVNWSISSAFNSGKQWLRLIRATSRERLGIFHISQPNTRPRFCTPRHGNAAISFKAPTASLPFKASTHHLDGTIKKD